MSELTKEDIEKIYDERGYEYGDNDSEDPFLEGLQIISKKSNVHNYGKDEYSFFASNIEEIDGLTEEDVIRLNQLGWRLDEEWDCFAKFI